MNASNFQTTDLTNDRVLVEGTDIRGTKGSQVIDASEWLDIKGRTNHSKAHEEYDAAVEAFFAPLTEAADKLTEDHERLVDPMTVVVLQEGVAATRGQDEVIHLLSEDSMILRLLEAGMGDRLIWINEELEILPEGSAPAIVSFEVGEAPAASGEDNGLRNTAGPDF